MSEEKQYSILMTDALAQKTYTGYKTQTRRVISFKDDPIFDLFDDENISDGIAGFDTKNFHNRLFKSRYGKVGSLVAIKESFYAYGKWEKLVVDGKAKHRFIDLTGTDFQYKYSNNPPERIQNFFSFNVGWFKRPSVFMPRRAVRSIVEIIGLRIERVQDISGADAICEGVDIPRDLPGDYGAMKEFALSKFQKLWDDINKSRGFGWKENPWVLVITYKNI